MILEQTIRYLFGAYTLLIIARVFGSWFPTFTHTQLGRFLIFCTEPYLKIFRRIIPPIGGMIDLSPLAAFFTLQVMEWLLLKVL